MRLDFVEACGFRGFRDKIRIDFGSGFTVISGRNGVGKSTLCDAVEFALIGSINKYKIESAAMESLNDYIWWRGGGTPKAHYVTVSFTKDDGEQYTITRARETGSNSSSEEIEDALCSGTRPENALNQLCRTSIIRDEWVAALSVDLSETERFRLVNSALGPLEGSDLGSRAKEIRTSATAAHAQDQRAYDAILEQLTKCLTELSEAKDVASRLGDIGAAMRLVAATLPDPPTETLALLTAGRAELVARRASLTQVSELVQQSREITALRQAFDSPQAQQRREAVRLALTNAAADKAEAEHVIVQAERDLVREEHVNAIATSLNLLVEHGERLGLHDEHCPLCAAIRTPQEFKSGLALTRERINFLASGVAAARQALAIARAKAERSLADHASAESQWMAVEQEETRLVKHEHSLIELFKQHGLDSSFVRNPNELEIDIAANRDQLIDLERALLTLEASQIVSRTTDLEDRIAVLRKDVETAADVIERSQSAITVAQSIERAVKRVNAEIIEERLAQISPLLNELYQRLRPHPDWRTIDYRIRGDVRRFLSLKIGDGLNPQFVLSSGQRRAVGLAFLLSVHLARAWTPWRTLLLDDPVQHIDDFRALHFVEILAALRLDDRQIVCTVEDASLADLLCRRLLSTTEQKGHRYDIEMGPEGVPAVIAESQIPPLSTSVLHRGDLAP